MKKFTIIYTLLFFVFGTISAQEKLKVSGIVSDSKGEPVPGVAVLILGTNQGNATDLKGAFSIDVKKGATLKFQCVGYISQEIKVDRNVINVVLKDDVTNMADIVVVGYSTQDRRSVIGSVASVKPTLKSSSATVDQLLQGQAAGVMMMTSSGALGSANQLQIRGLSSILGENNPLWVIDGVPVYGTGRSDNSVSTSGGAISGTSFTGTSVSSSLGTDEKFKSTFEKNPLATLNPEDIESIEVLKDAYATAIYGSRGSAGVILVTTKKGSRERTSVSVDYSMSIDRPIGKLDLLNGNEYNQIYSTYYNKTPFTQNYNTDWVDAVTRTAVSNSINASVSGGTQKTSYYISGSYLNQQSYIINNDMTRYSARVNLDTKLNKYFTLGANINFSQLDNGAISAPTIYSMAVRKAPNTPIYDELGNYFYGYGSNPYGDLNNYNPVAMARENKESTLDNRLSGDMYLDVKPTSWLTFRSRIGLDNYDSRTSIRKADTPLSGIVDNTAQESVSLRTRFVNDNTFTINHNFGYNHNIQAVIGQSWETSKVYSNSIVGSNFFSSEQVGVGAAQKRTVTDGGELKSALFSAFARLGYTYKNRYLAGFTYRLDGSSSFDKDNRFLGTPSFSLGWRASEENFIKDNYSWLTNLKFRGSIGWSSQNGNPTYYGAQAVYTIGKSTYMGQQYLSMGQPGNKDLGWEKTITYDAGFDMTLGDNIIDMTFDFYYKKTTDMLFSAQLPYYTGYQSQRQNIGDMRNRGFEVRITSTNFNRRNFTWLTTLTFANNQNRILKLDFTGSQMTNLTDGFKYYAVGESAAQFYLHQWGGVNALNGNPQWVMKDGSISEVAPASNNNTSNDNKFICGVAEPDFYGGINSNMTLFRNWELNMTFTYSYGGQLMNATKAQLLTYTTSDANNLHRDILKYWQIEGHNTGMPALHNASVTSNYDYTSAHTTTRFLEDNSYLRLKNFQIAYNVPSNWLKKFKVLTTARIYFTATNLFTLTKYSGLDPEVNAYGSSATSNGYDYMTMPQSRSYQFGVRLGF